METLSALPRPSKGSLDKAEAIAIVERGLGRNPETATGSQFIPVSVHSKLVRRVHIVVLEVLEFVPAF